MNCGWPCAGGCACVGVECASASLWCVRGGGSCSAAQSWKETAGRPCVCIATPLCTGQVDDQCPSAMVGAPWMRGDLLQESVV